MEMRSSPAISATSRRRWGVPVGVALVAMWSTAAAVVSATDGVAIDPDGLLDRPIVDVVIADRDPRDGTLDLLTVDQSISEYGQARLTLLHRDRVWSVSDEVETVMWSAGEGGNPWLVDLGDERFAAIATSWSPQQTTVVPITVDRPVRAGSLRVGPSVTVDMAVTAAGAADVDADGVAELVVAGEVGNGSEPCPRIELAVLAATDGFTTRAAGPIKLPGSASWVRLAGAALGEWDDRPGSDLLAHVYETCLSDEAEAHHLVAVNLRDLSTSVDLPMGDAVPPDSEPGVPIVVDVDGDGRDEALLMRAAEISLLDPADDWRIVTVGAAAQAPLAAIASSGGDPSAVLSWVEYGRRIATAHVARVDGALTVVATADQPLTGLSNALAQRLSTIQQFAASAQQLPPVLVADIDADGCPDLLGPMFLAPCAGTSPVSDGPELTLTRPLAFIGDGDERRLLVAEGLDWYPYDGASSPPWPAAAAPPGAWRNGWVTSFFLAERPVVAGSPWSASVPVPIVATRVSREGTIDIEAPTGTRLLVRANAIVAGGSVRSADLPDTDTFLRSEAFESEFITTIRIPTPAGTNPGASIGSTRFDLMGQVRRLDGSAADRWSVSVVALDAFGDASPPVTVTAIYDVTAPEVSLETPFLSAIWPFETTISGSSEAGASVRIAGGPAVTVGQTGAFGIPAHLAPWPQTVEVTAVDPSGNATVSRISVMGGVDLRRLPWAAIGAVAMLIAVIVSSIVGGRRVRTAVPVGVVASRDIGMLPATAADDDHLPEIEDLGERSLGRRG